MECNYTLQNSFFIYRSRNSICCCYALCSNVCLCVPHALYDEPIRVAKAWTSAQRSPTNPDIIGKSTACMECVEPRGFGHRESVCECLVCVCLVCVCLFCVCVLCVCALCVCLVCVCVSCVCVSFFTVAFGSSCLGSSPSLGDRCRQRPICRCAIALANMQGRGLGWR